MRKLLLAAVARCTVTSPASDTETSNPTRADIGTKNTLAAPPIVTTKRFSPCGFTASLRSLADAVHRVASRMRDRARERASAAMSSCAIENRKAPRARFSSSRPSPKVPSSRPLRRTRIHSRGACVTATSARSSTPSTVTGSARRRSSPMLPGVRETTSSREGSGIHAPSSFARREPSIETSAPVRSAVSCSTCDRLVNADELTRMPGESFHSTSTPDASSRDSSWARPVFRVVPDAGQAFSLDGCQGQRFMSPSVWDTRVARRGYTREENVSQLPG